MFGTIIDNELPNVQEESTFISLADDGDSREFFGLIKKVNNASEPKKREKTITCKQTIFICAFPFSFTYRIL